MFGPNWLGRIVIPMLNATAHAMATITAPRAIAKSRDL